jgi:hypothetical protein
MIKDNVEKERVGAPHNSPFLAQIALSRLLGLLGGWLVSGWLPPSFAFRWQNIDKPLVFETGCNEIIHAETKIFKHSLCFFWFCL